MSKDYQVNWSAHPNIYNNYKERSFNVYFSEPDAGVNSETGLLLLIAGFGGNANSSVYKKMRSQFADLYNLVTVQCDYFGHEFMQSSKRIHTPPPSALVDYFRPNEIAEIYKNGFDTSAFLRFGGKYNITVSLKENLDETEDNFNDMGIMQALDNITAICYVIQILRDNNLNFNTKKIIIYGHSHGAYLGYLCNAFAPNLFTYIIDNSAWLLPSYMQSNRVVQFRSEMLTIQVNFQYLASKLSFDEELLYLPSLYKNFSNNCMIDCFHGTTDFLISSLDKEMFCKDVPYLNYHEISENNLDGTIFKTTNHGLDSDFLAHFHFVMREKEFLRSTDLIIPTTRFATTKNLYEFNYDYGVPLLKIS